MMERSKISDMMSSLGDDGTTGAQNNPEGTQGGEDANNTQASTQTQESAHVDEIDEAIATKFVPNVPYKTTVSVDSIDSLLSEVSSTINAGMNTVEWVGSINYLLSYIVELQSAFRLTLPLSTLGISTEMFKYVPRDNDSLYHVGENLYELIEIDGDCFLSCMTAPIDVDRFKSTVQELLCSMNEGGEYELRRAGYRIFAGANNVMADASAIKSDVDDRALVYALNLNSYEIMALCKYAETLPGIVITNEEDKDHGAVLRFVLKS